MNRFLKALCGGVVIVAAVLLTAPPSKARLFAAVIAVVWIVASVLMAHIDRRQQAAKARRSQADCQAGASRNY
jgi:hypothetical protein